VWIYAGDKDLEIDGRKQGLQPYRDRGRQAEHLTTKIIRNCVLFLPTWGFL
jgi:hypothetical protein